MRITKSSVSNGLIFFIGLFWFVHIRVVGDLFFSELALILIFLFMYKNHGYKLREPLPKKILLFGLLWLLGQVATDLIRMSPVGSLMKGWASIIKGSASLILAKVWDTLIIPNHPLHDYAS